MQTKNLPGTKSCQEYELVQLHYAGFNYVLVDHVHRDAAVVITFQLWLDLQGHFYSIVIRDHITSPNCD